jgi:putative transcriptional regulator
MTIRHHLTADILLSYAAGNLAEGWSLAVATHLALCPDCRSREAQFSAIGGEALEDAAPAELADDALAACFAMIDLGNEVQPPLPPVLVGTPTLPEPLRGYVGGDADTVRWSSVGGGIRQHLIAVSSNAKARLLYIPAGDKVPQHGHRGLELTLVLSGSFADGSMQFHRGDIEIADEQVNHTPTAGPGEPCICLAVTDAPIVFKSLLPRLVQRFVGI